ncbi:hypothetical protein GCM10022243_18340 [Saccharothrix violaceirubra]|uniref:O-methyltransferase n=1 Tax=Saccharothrix violaceirubra TaxID=413306 RepID=A0A7W7T2A7_9PSEU|nr:methyltransferase dimerization domain-containing protein [Saccharothrix violaceirubra]MBB4965259.1 hypothetical protein [Saccharothrix violaceirubra]
MTDPTPLVNVATGFMAAKQLFAASELGVFAALAAGPATSAELAERAGLPERTARILADAMVGLELLAFADGKYTNTAVTAEYLSGGDGLDLRPWLGFWNGMSYPHWLHYTESMRTAQPGPFQLDESNMGEFMNGVQTYNSLHAQQLAEHYDWRLHKNVLDLGGLAISFLTEAAARNPELTGAFVTTPDFIKMLEGSLTGELADRIKFQAADPLTDEIPGHYDAVLLEHVLHRFTPEQNKTFFTAARKVVDPGARLLVVDFLLLADDARRIDPILAGEYLVIDGTVVYPEAEVVSWLGETGWKFLETRPIPGSPRVVIAEAV